jgi:Nif-specific regulatory protein
MSRFQEPATATDPARHNRELDALCEISRLLAERSGQQQLLSDVLDVLETKLVMRRATVMLLSADGGELHAVATRDADPIQVKDLRYRFGEGIIGSVAEQRHPRIVPRVAEEPGFVNRIHKRSAAESDSTSFLCVPIMLDGVTVGTLSVDVAEQPAELLQELTRLLEIVAGMIAYDAKSRRLAAEAQQNLEAENLRLRSALGEHFRPENIVGNSKAMLNVYQRIHQVAASDATVLIRGESGTGKELVASAIHYASHRRDKPFIKVNCAALSESLLESELFGHEKGAFTGALYERAGRIEEAQGGTFFLDEIGDFSPAVQVKLLRVLQEREFERVGSNQTRKADVRVIAATNRDLETAVERGQFRPDLYYRINVVPIFLPPLRERRNDILLLADHFVAKYSQRMARRVVRISTPAINMMLAYHWPGNVRELENCIEYAVLMATEGVIHGHNLPPSLQMPEAAAPGRDGTLQTQVQLLERDLIVDALKCTDGNMAAAARQLGITARMIRYKVKNLGIDCQVFQTTDRAPATNN